MKKVAGRNTYSNKLLLSLVASLCLTNVTAVHAAPVTLPSPSLEQSHNNQTSAAAYMPQGLKDVVNHVLHTNPALLSEQMNIEINQDILRQIRASYFPTANLELAYGRERSENPTLKDQNIDHVYYNRKENSITVEQLLFDGGKRSNDVRSQRHKTKESEFNFYGTREATILATISSYVDLWRTNQLVIYAKDNVDRHVDVYDKVVELYEGGGTHKANVELASSKLAFARTTLLSAEQDMRIAMAEFESITGLKPNNLKPLDDKSPKLRDDFGQLLNYAKDHNPLIIANRYALDGTDHDIAAAKAAFIPDVSVQVRSSYNENIDGVEGANSDVQAMLLLRYNLFRGGADKARIDEARARKIQARYNYEQLHRDVARNLNQDWTTHQSNQFEIKRLEDFRAATERLLAAYNEQFAIGKQSLFNVLDAGNQLYNSQAALVNKKNDDTIIYYRILAVMGKLSGTFIDSEYYSDR